MRINVETLPAEGVVFKIDVPARQFPILSEMQSQGECHFISNITGEITAKKVLGLVMVTGKIYTQVRLVCMRCLEKYQTVLSDRFSVSFTQKLLDDEAQSELELQTRDLELMSYQGDVIALDDMVQEQVVLAFPGHPVCGKNCKGLCRTCGANLNKTTCHCSESSPVDPRLAILSKLKLPGGDSR